MSERNRVKRVAPWITRRLRLGLGWLWENKRQSRGAMIGSAGIYTRAGECLLGINPDAYKGMPVVVLEISYIFEEHGRPEGRLTTEEVETFTGLVERAAWKVGHAMVLEMWGGTGDASFSLQLSRRCGKGPRSLIEAHNSGCQKPEHRDHHGLCSWDGCMWFEDGYKRARLPQGWS